MTCAAFHLRSTWISCALFKDEKGGVGTSETNDSRISDFVRYHWSLCRYNAWIWMLRWSPSTAFSFLVKECHSHRSLFLSLLFACCFLFTSAFVCKCSFLQSTGGMKTIYVIFSHLLTVLVLTKQRRSENHPHQYFRHSWAKMGT